MLNFKKVITKDKSTEDENSGTSQGNYNKKVNELRKACERFGNYLKKEVTEETKFLDIAKEFEGEKNGFGKQMKKSWLLSRTSRRLQEMKKNLLKSKNETFDPQKIDDFVKCFKFKREEPKKGYIKRSAIDDKKVYDFFNSTNSTDKDSIRGILSVKQKEAQAGLFDKKTGTFTIRTEDGFKRIEGFKDKIKNVVVGEGITTIKDKAFDGCTALASVKLKNVKTIGNEAFYIHRSLTSIDLGNVQTIGEQAFKFCTALTSIDFKNVQTIGNEAFYNCAALTSIDFKNVQTIGDKAFWLCDSLASVDLGNVQTIGKRAFIFCPALTSIDFKNVQTIDEYAFSECPALTSIDLGNVQTIERSAFSNCKALGKLGIDFKNVQTIGEWAFVGCTSLASIDLGNVTTIKNNAFVGCTALASINLGNVKTIENKAFRQCTALASIDFKNVQTIGNEAFWLCDSLASINLGNVQTIGDKAFKGCTGIKKVILPKDGTKAEEIRDIICSQTGKTAGDGNNNNTIEFINAPPEPAAATQKK